MMEKVVDVLINNGIAGVVILILFYGIYKTANPVLKSFLASVKAQTEANMKFAQNITELSKEIGQLAKTNISMLENISGQIDNISGQIDNISGQIEDSKDEIISHIKKKL